MENPAKIDKNDLNLVFNAVVKVFKEHFWKEIPEDLKDKRVKEILQKQKLTKEEKKELLNYIFKNRDKIEQNIRKQSFNNLIQYLKTVNTKATPKEILKEFKNKYGFDFEKFAKPTLKEVFKKEAPGYGIAIGSGIPIGGIGYLMEEKLKTSPLISQGTMALLSMLSSYGSEFVTGETKRYGDLLMHVVNRHMPIIMKGFTSWFTANLFKNLLKKITSKSQ